MGKRKQARGERPHPPSRPALTSVEPLDAHIAIVRSREGLTPEQWHQVQDFVRDLAVPGVGGPIWLKPGSPEAEL